MSSTQRPVGRHRFTGQSKTERSGRSPRAEQIKARDGHRCVFCGASEVDLTIDHVVPLAHGGTDETTNYVTACRPCNARKADLPASVFAKAAGIDLSDLPVSGDPVIDNPNLPEEVRRMRKRVYDAVRSGIEPAQGKSAHQKVEKAYRRELWSSDIGQALAQEYPTLPGHVRAMLPEIEVLAKTDRERALLIELAKSANTREMIGKNLVLGSGIEAKVKQAAEDVKDPALKKRLEQALRRFHKIVGESKPE